MVINKNYTSILASWGKTLSVWQQFIRLPGICFTMVMPFAGVATVTSDLTTGQILALIIFAITFHCFAYVFNDIVDVDVDRLNSDRREYPLVTGKISMELALFFALVQIPIALWVTYWLSAGLLGYMAFFVAFLGLAIYDKWGKVNPFPPLTDVVQGIGGVL